MTILKALKLLALSAWLTVVPIHSALIAIMCLPIIDLVLALVVAKRQKTPITSGGLKRTVAKILMYEAATLLAYLTETALLGSLLPVVRMVTGLIGMTELKSCLEHLDLLGSGPIFESLLARLAPSSAKTPPPAGDNQQGPE